MKRSILFMIMAMIAFAAATGLSDERQGSESAEQAGGEKIRHDKAGREGRESAEAAVRREREIHEERRNTELKERRKAVERQTDERQERRRDGDREHPEREISNTRRATGMLKISYDQYMLPLEPEIVENLIRSSVIRAARQMNFLKFDTQQRCIMANRDYLLYNFEIDIAPDAEPLAEELIHAIINHLRESLEITFHQHLEENERNMKRAVEKCINAENELKELQNQTREIAVNALVNREELQAMIQDLTNELNKMDMEMAFSEQRIKELSEQINKARQQAQEKLETDPVLKDLKEIIALSENNLHHAEEQVKAGRQPAEILEQSKEKLMKARIELARRREELVLMHGGTKAEQFAEKTTDLTMEMSQFRIKRQAVSRRLEEIRRKLIHADEYEILAIKIDMAKEKLAHSLEMKNDMELTDIHPPHVYVIGGD